MKRILVSLSMIAVVAAAGVGATRAFFSDSVTSTGNTFSAGTLSLTVDTTHNNGTGKFNLTNLKPGDDSAASSTTISYAINNAGSIDGFLNLTNIVVTPTAGTGPGHTTTGYHLGSHLNIVVKVGGVQEYSGTLDGFNANASLGLINVPVAHGASTTVTIDYAWPSTGTDNDAQGDSAQVGLGFNLSQTTLQ